MGRSLLLLFSFVRSYVDFFAIVFWVVTCASDCLEKRVPKMTSDVLSRTWNSAHSFTLYRLVIVAHSVLSVSVMFRWNANSGCILLFCYLKPCCFYANIAGLAIVNSEGYWSRSMLVFSDWWIEILVKLTVSAFSCCLSFARQARMAATWTAWVCSMCSLTCVAIEWGSFKLPISSASPTWQSLKVPSGSFQAMPTRFDGVLRG